MAVTFSKKNTSGKGRRQRTVLMSDINVTPFVDVMLVLLIVFMVTAPLLTVGVPVDLPKSDGKTLSDTTKDPLTVSLNAQGKIFLQNTEVPQENLVDQLKNITEANKDTRIFVRGDKTLSYGRIMEIMGMISAAGFTKVALIADLKTEGSFQGTGLHTVASQEHHAQKKGGQKGA